MRDAYSIKAIAELQEKATRLIPIETIEDPRQMFFDQRGSVVSQDLPVPARNHTVNTIESFAASVARYAKEATVWCVLDRVTCVLADSDLSHRCDRVTLPVTASECFGVLARQDWTQQQQLIDTLRHSLAAAEIDPPNTLALLRNLKFSTQTEQVGKFTNASAAMGKSVASQVTGESDLPESVSVEFHPFPSLADEIDVAVVVWCTLFTDPASGKLKLAPRQGELEKARTQATRALAATVKGVIGDTPLFIGTP